MPRSSVNSPVGPSRQLQHPALQAVRLMLLRQAHHLLPTMLTMLAIPWMTTTVLSLRPALSDQRLVLFTLIQQTVQRMRLCITLTLIY